MPLNLNLYTGIKFIRIHKKDLNGLGLGDSFSFAEDLSVIHSNGTYVYTIQSMTKDPNNPSVYYLEVRTTKSTAPANTSNAITVFSPNIAQDVDYNEYNAILNNAVSSELSTTHYQVDRNTVQALPNNLDAILNGSAQRAEVSPQITSATGMVNARYSGTGLGPRVGEDRTLDVTVPYFATFDSIKQTSDIGGVYQLNIPYVVDADGNQLPTTDVKTLYYDMPSIFTQETLADTAVRFSELSSVNEQRTQRRFTDRFEIFKGGQDVTTLAVSTSGSLNSKGDTVTVRSGSFFQTIVFGEDVGVGDYRADATFSGSDGGRTQVTKNTEKVVDYRETFDPFNRYSQGEYTLNGEAECDLSFNSTILLSYDRDGTGWKKDMKTIVRMEVSGDGGSTWNTIKQITIPRYWNRYEVSEADVPEDVFHIGHRVIDGITGIYLAVNLKSGYIPFGDQKLRTVVRFETSGNDDCFINNKFEFLDKNGNPLQVGAAVSAAGLLTGAGILGGAALAGVSFGLSSTGIALAVLAGPVGAAAIGAAAIGGVTIGGLLKLRNLFGKIKYQDFGINQNYVNVKFKEGLPTLYTEFKASQEIPPQATVSMAAAPFSRSLGGPLSTDLAAVNINYGSQGNPWIALSPSLQLAEGAVQSLTDHEPLGFKDFIEPFRLQVGDQIKFEGNENKVHTIVEIVPRSNSLPPTYRGSLYTLYKVHPPIAGKTWVKNFQVRRFIQDPTSVLVKGNEDRNITNKLYFTSSSLKGTITPQYLSPTLEENFADYKQQLIAKGIIS